MSRGSAAACLLGLRVRIPPGSWMFVSGECYVLSRGFVDGPITRLEDSHCVRERERSDAIITSAPMMSR